MLLLLTTETNAEYYHGFKGYVPVVAHPNNHAAAAVRRNNHNNNNKGIMCGGTAFIASSSMVTHKEEEEDGRYSSRNDNSVEAVMKRLRLNVRIGRGRRYKNNNE